MLHVAERVRFVVTLVQLAVDLRVCSRTRRAHGADATRLRVQRETYRGRRVVVVPTYEACVRGNVLSANAPGK